MKIASAIGEIACSGIIVIVLAGTVAGTMQGKGFDGQKAWQFAGNVYNRIVHGVDLGMGRVEPSKETPRELVQNNINNLTELMPSPSPQATPQQSARQPQQQLTIDLSKCISGTVNQSNNLSNSQVEILQKGQFKSLWEVQNKVGNPLCAISSTSWLYRSDSTLLIATESKGKVVIKNVY